MGIKNICLQCGDVGYETSLVYCNNCQECAVHRYCMDVMPNPNDKSVDWLCEDCIKSKPSKKFRKRRRVVVESDNEITRREPGVETKSKYMESECDNEVLCKGSKGFLYSFAAAGGITCAEPLVRPIWTGCFEVESGRRRMEGFAAHLSVRSCEKVINEAAAFEKVMPVEILQRSFVWPKSFEASGPTDDNIAVYFFPSLMKYEDVYDYLVFEMMRDDVAMRVRVRNAELLIFTSVELPSRFRRFQGKLYLWGVFREKQAA
ncbi:uncharacterized protein LOC110012398 [Sesamum indicum]|uniref:Uncharacterized protein LOC110012398 n=1 Tax=Sesamum indicum TaxID=4182 RepID=A0A8M8V537_SESIN|nr:uncharacterized protein LOC110012398 [Sesamum indicum]